MGRVSTFADPEVIRLTKEQFVPLTGDDWYQRRRQDAEGEFFRKVADQGPRKGQGGSTRQGMYIFTATGKLLTYRNHHDPVVMRGELQKALKAWNKLPAEERKPGAVQVEEWSKADARYDRQPPKDALIVNVFTRILEKNDKGEYAHTSCDFSGGERAAHDHLWIPAEEWRPLFGNSPMFPERLALRLARFHLVDNTRGEPPAWQLSQVRTRDVSLTVEEANGTRGKVRVVGSFLMTTNADPAKADRGFEVRILGYVRFQAGKVTGFNLIALGEHWGQGPYTRGARPGRQPLGVAFELSRGDAPPDRVPPQFARSWREYLMADQ